MKEHSGLLTLELLKENIKYDEPLWDIERIRKMCVFTTHTPIPPGMDKFSYELVEQLLGDYIPIDFLKSVGGVNYLNMTLLALNLSHYENGVAKEHGIISREMFPGYHIDSITNGVNSATWVCDCFKELYDKYIRGWKSDSFSLRYALSIPNEDIWAAHQSAKDILIKYINEKRIAGFEPDVFTIGFARRATAYKRADLIFFDIERLEKICTQTGKIQIVFAGKAHPRDFSRQGIN